MEPTRPWALPGVTCPVHTSWAAIGLSFSFVTLDGVSCEEDLVEARLVDLDEFVRLRQLPLAGR